MVIRTKHAIQATLPRDRSPIQGLPLVLLDLVQFLPSPRPNGNGLCPSKLVGTLHQPDWSIPDVFSIHLLPCL